MKKDELNSNLERTNDGDWKIKYKIRNVKKTADVFQDDESLFFLFSLSFQLVNSGIISAFKQHNTY